MPRKKRDNNNISSAPKALGQLLNRTQTAKFFGVAPTTVDAWIRRGCPVVKQATGRGRGKTGWLLDSAAVAEWLRTEAVEAAAGNAEALDFEKQRARKMAVQTELAEYDLAERRRTMIRVEDVAAIVGREYATCRGRLLAIPSKLAPVLAPMNSAEEVREALEGEIVEALEELAAHDGAGAVVEEAEVDGGGDGAGDRPPDDAS